MKRGDYLYPFQIAEGTPYSGFPFCRVSSEVSISERGVTRLEQSERYAKGPIFIWAYFLKIKGLLLLWNICEILLNYRREF